MSPKLRYYHDHEWHDIGGALEVRSFRARQKNHSPQTLCVSGNNTTVTFDEWKWETSSTAPSGSPFSPHLTSGKMDWLNLSKPGLYAFECEALWDSNFAGSRAILMNDFSLDFPSDTSTLHQAGISSGANVLSHMRRISQADLDLIGGPVAIMMQVWQNSGSIQLLEDEDTYMEAHYFGLT